MGLERLNPLRTKYYGGNAAEGKGSAKQRKEREKQAEAKAKRAQARGIVMKCHSKKIKVGSKCGKPGSGIYCNKHAKYGTILNT
jgi:hypothetical protein